MFLFCVFALSETSLPHQQQSSWLCSCKNVFYCLNALLHFILLHTCIVSTTCTQSRRSITKEQRKTNQSLVISALFYSYFGIPLILFDWKKNDEFNLRFLLLFCFLFSISLVFSSLRKLLKFGLFLNGLIMPYISYDWIKITFAFQVQKMYSFQFPLLILFLLFSLHGK